MSAIVIVILFKEWAAFQVMNKAILQSDSTYRIPNFKCTSHLCRTNLPSNTAFRGFGGPQGMLICEAWMANVAATLSMEPEKVRMEGENG
jgi:xanthine dehydrogenase/oxidase